MSESIPLEQQRIAFHESISRELVGKLSQGKINSLSYDGNEIQAKDKVSVLFDLLNSENGITFNQSSVALYLENLNDEERGYLVEAVKSSKIGDSDRLNSFLEVVPFSNEKSFANPMVSTDKKMAGARDSGYDYMAWNEDEMLMYNNAMLAVDGMGGMGVAASGKIGAKIFQTNMIIAFANIDRKLGENNDPDFDFKGFFEKEMQDAQARAHGEMKDKDLEDGGVVYSAVRIHENKAYIAHAGDAKVVIIGEYGNIRFQTKDHTAGNFSLEEAKAYNEFFFNSMNGKDDQEKYENFLINAGHMPVNSVDGKKPGSTTVKEFDLEEGDRIIVASDGVWDNYTPEELADAIKDKNTPEEVIKFLDYEMVSRIIDQGKKKDNRSIVVYDYDGELEKIEDVEEEADPEDIGHSEKLVSRLNRQALLTQTKDFDNKKRPSNVSRFDFGKQKKSAKKINTILSVNLPGSGINLLELQSKDSEFYKNLGDADKKVITEIYEHLDVLGLNPDGSKRVSPNDVLTKHKVQYKHMKVIESKINDSKDLSKDKIYEIAGKLNIDNLLSKIGVVLADIEGSRKKKLLHPNMRVSAKLALAVVANVRANEQDLLNEINGDADIDSLTISENFSYMIKQLVISLGNLGIGYDGEAVSEDTPLEQEDFNQRSGFQNVMYKARKFWGNPKEFFGRDEQEDETDKSKFQKFKDNARKFWGNPKEFFKRDKKEAETTTSGELILDEQADSFRLIAVHAFIEELSLLEDDGVDTIIASVIALFPEDDGSWPNSIPFDEDHMLIILEGMEKHKDLINEVTDSHDQGGGITRLLSKEEFSFMNDLSALFTFVNQDFAQGVSDKADQLKNTFYKRETKGKPVGVSDSDIMKTISVDPVVRYELALSASDLIQELRDDGEKTIGKNVLLALETKLETLTKPPFAAELVAIRKALNTPDQEIEISDELSKAIAEVDRAYKRAQEEGQKLIDEEEGLSNNEKNLWQKMKEADIPVQTMALFGVNMAVRSQVKSATVIALSSLGISTGAAIPVVGGLMRLYTDVDKMKEAKANNKSARQTLVENAGAVGTGLFTYKGERKARSASQEEIDKYKKKDIKWGWPIYILQKAGLVFDSPRRAVVLSLSGVTEKRGLASKQAVKISEELGIDDIATIDDPSVLKEALKKWLKGASYYRVRRLGVALSQLNAMGDYGASDKFGEEGTVLHRVKKNHDADFLAKFHQQLNIAVDELAGTDDLGFAKGNGRRAKKRVKAWKKIADVNEGQAGRIRTGLVVAGSAVATALTLGLPGIAEYISESGDALENAKIAGDEALNIKGFDPENPWDGGIADTDGVIADAGNAGEPFDPDNSYAGDIGDTNPVVADGTGADEILKDYQQPIPDPKEFDPNNPFVDSMGDTPSVPREPLEGNHNIWQPDRSGDAQQIVDPTKRAEQAQEVADKAIKQAQETAEKLKDVAEKAAESSNDLGFLEETVTYDNTFTHHIQAAISSEVGSSNEKINILEKLTHALNLDDKVGYTSWPPGSGNLHVLTGQELPNLPGEITGGVSLSKEGLTNIARIIGDGYKGVSEETATYLDGLNNLAEGQLPPTPSENVLYEIMKTANPES